MRNGAIAFDENEVFERINKICDKLESLKNTKRSQQNREWIIHKLPDRFKVKYTQEIIGTMAQID